MASFSTSSICNLLLNLRLGSGGSSLSTEAQSSLSPPTWASFSGRNSKVFPGPSRNISPQWDILRTPEYSAHITADAAPICRSIPHSFFLLICEQDPGYFNHSIRGRTNLMKPTESVSSAKPRHLILKPPQLTSTPWLRLEIISVKLMNSKDRLSRCFPVKTQFFYWGHV